MNRLVNRFPGVCDDWAQFDGPAGTQMVDTAIAAMSDWASSGFDANCGRAYIDVDDVDRLVNAVARIAGE